MRRGEVWWANLPRPIGSEPAGRRPVVVLQDDTFNATQLRTLVVVGVTRNMRRAHLPGHVFLSRADSGLPDDSVVNAFQVITTDKATLSDRVRQLPPHVVASIEEAVRVVLGLP